MKNQFVMTWINRIYSFIHIPGSIVFLVWLFYYTNTRNRIDDSQRGKGMEATKRLLAGPRLYEFAEKDNGVLQSSCIHRLHALAMYATETSQRGHYG